jgi:hypothetical protein
MKDNPSRQADSDLLDLNAYRVGYTYSYESAEILSNPWQIKSLCYPVGF